MRRLAGVFRVAPAIAVACFAVAWHEMVLFILHNTNFSHGILSSFRDVPTACTASVAQISPLVLGAS